MQAFKQLNGIYTKFSYLNVVSKRRTFVLIFLFFCVMIFEALSIISIMPLIKFIQVNQDIEVFANTTTYGKKIIFFYNYLNISFNTFTLTVLVATLFFIRQTFKLLENIEIERTRLYVARNLTILCFKNILSAKAEYIRRFKIGNLTALCEKECEQSAVLYRTFFRLVGVVAQLFGYVILMFFVSPIITILSIISLILIILSNTFLVKKSHNAGKNVVSTRKDLYGYMTENFSLWRLSKFRNILNYEVVGISKLANSYAKNLLRYHRYSAYSRLLIAALIMILCIFIITFSTNNLNLNFENFALFAVILIRLIPIGQQFTSFFNTIAAYVPAINYIYKVVLDTNTNKEKLDIGKKFYKINKYIKFENICFKYNKSQNNIIENLNLKVPAKKFTVILGRSGSGKSTLIDLIPRIIIEQQGKILLDEIDINQFSLRSIRNSLSYVPQESFLIDGTIKDNICYFNRNPSKKDLYEAIKLSGAHEFIDKFPDGINTKIKEKGNNISGGQKQRIVLARAFLSKSPILILDEATSAMDTYLEKNFREAIKKLKNKKNKTIIMITHKLNLVENADFVALLSNGRITKSGKPNDVLNKYLIKEK